MENWVPRTVKLRATLAPRWPCLAVCVIAVLTAMQERVQGRRWWCGCGGWQLWWSDTKSSHNSQHLFDPYTFTHVVHGFLFYAVFAWLFPRAPRPWRMALAVAIEAAWESVENTDFIINRYRSVTISLDYFGDSIANSLGDILACLIGFVLVPKLGLWGSVAVGLVIEIALLCLIRDNLTLNVLMLIHPSDAIRAWQMNP